MAQPEMDNAAREAAKELPTNGSFADVKAWWQKWFMTAGHNRLAAVLLGRKI